MRVLLLLLPLLRPAVAQNFFLSNVGETCAQRCARETQFSACVDETSPSPSATAMVTQFATVFPSLGVNCMSTVAESPSLAGLGHVIPGSMTAVCSRPTFAGAYSCSASAPDLSLVWRTAAQSSPSAPPPAAPPPFGALPAPRRPARADRGMRLDQRRRRLRASEFLGYTESPAPAAPL